jgi:hypothetical protein
MVAYVSARQPKIAAYVDGSGMGARLETRCRYYRRTRVVDT